MLAYGVEPAKRLEPLARWPALTLILAACVGGGGGSCGGGTPPVIAGFEPVEFSYQSDGTYLGKVPENTVNVTNLLGPDISRLWSGYGVTVQSVDVVSDATANIIVSGPTGTATVIFSISGLDANRFKLVQSGSREAVIQFKTKPDYELPLDQNGDNIFEGELQATIAGVATERASFKVVVTNDTDGSTSVASPAGRSSVPPHSREGDMIKITIVEGNDEIFLIKTASLGTFAPNLIAGPDADKFNFEIVNVEGQRQTVIKFKQAPNNDAPTDVGGDNVYNFEFDGNAEAMYGDIKFEVTVVDNPIL